MSEAVTETLNERVLSAMTALRDNFIFRKLGMVYDYAALPEQFPLPTLPVAKEASSGKPNPAGLGTGMADCAFHGGLIFDGYLARIELGLDGADEERILDRLIGGLIRTGTTAPKGALIRGLAPDSRGFYPQVDPENALGWLRSVQRGFLTGAILPDSQQKMQNILAKAMAHLEAASYVLPPENSSAVCLRTGGALAGLTLLAFLAVSARVTGEEKWKTQFEAFAAENNGALLDVPAPASSPRVLLATQLALGMIRDCLPKEHALLPPLETLMRKVGRDAEPRVDDWRQLDASVLDDAPLPDWRTEDVPSTTELPASWSRLVHERDTVASAMQAALAVFLSGDKELAQGCAESVGACLGQTDWTKLRLASALAPTMLIHAIGSEMELWDKDLMAFKAPGDPSLSLTAKYMTEEFDEKNPDKAGHDDAPPPRVDPYAKYDEKEEPAQGSSKNKRKRRRGRRRGGKGGSSGDGQKNG